MYIDVHTDQLDDEKKEHGVKIHIDEYFHVRSNNVLNFKSKAFTKLKKKSIPGIPMPELKVTESKFSEETISWNYFQIDSHPHNVSLRIENIRGLRGDASRDIKMESPLRTINTTMRYNYNLLSDEYLEITNNWIELLIKWVELSTELDVRIILPILRFIDKHHSIQPSIQDELSISILADDTSMIRLTDEISSLDKIFKYSNDDMSGMYPLMGLNEEALKYISFILNHKKFVVIKDLIINLGEAGGVDANEFVDTFIQIFFDLMARDAFEYQVSYFS